MRKRGSHYAVSCLSQNTWCLRSIRKSYHFKGNSKTRLYSPKNNS